MTPPTLDRLNYLMRTRARLLKSQGAQVRSINEMLHFDKKAGREMERMCREALKGIESSFMH